MMKIGYMSDLHLEFKNYPKLGAETGDVLIIAGDMFPAAIVSKHRTDQSKTKLMRYLLGPFKDYISGYDTVLYVMGNHDHYNSSFKNTAKHLRDFFAEHDLNITLLDNDFLDKDGIRFIGCTLWSDFNKRNPLSMGEAETWMNDYRLISLFDRLIDSNFILWEHLNSVDYIRMLAGEAACPVVVVTHHAPSFMSVDKNRYDARYNLLNGAYASDLSDLILDNKNIEYWIHGHTHYNVDYKVGHCRVLAHQFGYSHEKTHKMFKGPKFLEIDNEI